MNANTSRCGVAVTAALLTPLAATAAVPMMTPLQGVFRDNAGALVGEEAFVITFSLYGSAEVESPVWTES